MTEVAVTTANWSYKSCKAPVKWSPSTTSLFYRPDALPVAQLRVSNHWRKISHSMDLLTPSSPGVFQLCLWPLIAPGNLGGGSSYLSLALGCQYLFRVCPLYSNLQKHRPVKQKKRNETRNSRDFEASFQHTLGILYLMTSLFCCM